MSNEVKYDEIGEWSELKLEIIREYAKAYANIMAKQNWTSRRIYIDAFAGAGKHISKATGDFVQGSPQIALTVRPPFDEFHFIDLDNRRVEALEELSASQDNVRVYHGDCNDILLSEVFERCHYDDFARALCLIDPYGLNVRWEMLRRAGELRTVDIFFNFMIVAANRNVLWNNRDNVSPEQIEKMNALWGDDSWKDIVYKPVESLFPDVDNYQKQSNEVIAEAFRQRLKNVAGFKHVPKPLAMRNSIGATIYYLYFASNNQTGEKIANAIFRKHGG